MKFAGFWIRAWAELIDSTLLTLVSWILTLVVLKLALGDPDAMSPFAYQIFSLGMYGSCAFPYYVWLQYRWGTTIGKVVFRVYVVNNEDGAPITLTQSVVRAIGSFISYLPFFAGYIMVIFHPRKRALHDLMAGTVSIRKLRRNELVTFKKDGDETQDQRLEPTK